jgi:hypothetical protein
MSVTTRDARFTEREDGSIVLSNAIGLPSTSTTMVDWLDQGEVTDKGQLNQARVLRQRSAVVAAAYADVPKDNVICL